MEKYSFEKIIGRKEKKIDIKKFNKDLKGKTVMIAGVGSIGTHLAKLLIQTPLKMLYLVDFNEATLSNVRDELTASGYKNFKTVLADLKSIQQTKQLDTLEYDYIINAAAYKHVIFCEENENNAWANNFNVAINLLTLRAKHHLLISTDKAVYPSNTMGATKRACEFAYLIKDNTKIVRFGNVYNTSGSLIPRLLHTLEKKTVYITDEKATRYFMSMDEACSLIIDSMLNSPRKMNILDMGKPVKIKDVIDRVIKESKIKGVKVVKIGLQPGEKLHEELEYKNKMNIHDLRDKLLELTSKKPMINVIKELEYDVEEIICQESKKTKTRVN